MKRLNFGNAGGGRGILLLPILILLSGCARYEYLLVEPAGHAHALTRTPLPVPVPPLDYQLAEQNRRLTIRISNPTGGPVTLVGSRSYVVDPGGHSHPLASGTIAPASHAGLVLPPPPRVYRTSPSFTLGLGFGRYYSPYHFPGPYYGARWGAHYDPFYDGPAYYYPVNPPHHWEWKTGEVRLRLFYEQNATNTFDHHFTFSRRKVK